MGREERRRKFHESLKQILFPPPPSPPSPPPQELNVEDLINSNPHDLIPDELGELGTSSSSEDEKECGTQKPTRAQRKRVRKMKIKEDKKRRKGIIGPLTAPPDKDEGVRQNTSENNFIKNDQTGELVSYTNQSKIKHRRRAKKLAKEKSNSLTVEQSQQDCDPITNTEA